MQTAAKFEKVSFQVFRDSCAALEMPLDADGVITAYEEIILPKRATKGSAGYDFFSPITLTLGKGESAVIPTGIRCKMNEGWVLALCPRSGMGFKTGIHLANTIGIIDQDYYFSDNEGHIMLKLVNDSALARRITIESGSAMCQGILLPFGIAEGDDAAAERNGGFGSTGK